MSCLLATGFSTGGGYIMLYVQEYAHMRTRVEVERVVFRRS